MMDLFSSSDPILNTSDGDTKYLISPVTSGLQENLGLNASRLNAAATTANCVADQVSLIRRDIELFEKKICDFEDRVDFMPTDPRYRRWMNEKSVLVKTLGDILIKLSSKSGGKDSGKFESAKSLASGLIEPPPNSVMIDESVDFILDRTGEKSISALLEDVPATGSTITTTSAAGVLNSTGGSGSSNNISNEHDLDIHNQTQSLTPNGIYQQQYQAYDTRNGYVDYSYGGNGTMNMHPRSGSMSGGMMNNSSINGSSRKIGAEGHDELQLEEYLRYKEQLASIMRDFSNKKIHFISAVDNTPIYIPDYQVITSLVKEGNPIEGYVRGQSLSFKTGINKKTQSFTETKLFIPHYEEGGMRKGLNNRNKILVKEDFGGLFY